MAWQFLPTGTFGAPEMKYLFLIYLDEKQLAAMPQSEVNALNARHTADLAAMLRRRGYHFVTFDQAMSDTAYALPDRYIGARGPSWLERWAVTRGVRPGRPPEIPEWVRQYNGVTGNR